VSGNIGALLISLFNVEWGWYAQAGGVEVLEFCLFLWFFLQGVSPTSLQDFTLGSTLSASSFWLPSWNLLVFFPPHDFYLEKKDLSCYSFI
jgi:hypothetical protein